ncbi:MAG TPA: hypothetical protein EYQ84_01800 [Nitrospinaceae bacterium]|nr:hypothetical protein [Nitrospinaceae bacterium]
METSSKLSIVAKDSTEQHEQNPNNKRKRELNENDDADDDDNVYVDPKKFKSDQENTIVTFLPQGNIISNQENRKNGRKRALNKTKDNNMLIAPKKNNGKKSIDINSKLPIFNKDTNKQQHVQGERNKRKREVNEDDDDDDTYIAQKKFKLDNNNHQSTELSSRKHISHQDRSGSNNNNKRKRESNENEDEDTYITPKRLRLDNNGAKNKKQCSQNKKKYRKVLVRETKLALERNNNTNTPKYVLPSKRRHEDDDNGLYVVPQKMRLYEKKPIIRCIDNKSVQNKWIKM